MKNIIILILVLFVISAGVYGTFLYKDKATEKPTTEVKVTDKNDKQPQSAKLSDFQILLANGCGKDKKIAIESIPFELTSGIKGKYNLTDTIACSPNSEELSLSATTYYTGIDKNTTTSDLKLGDKYSNDYSPAEYFSLNKTAIPSFTIDGVKIYIDFQYPGPYGISSNALLLDVKAYKQIGDYVIISASTKRIAVTGEVLELMKKYADKDNKFTDPQYTVIKNQKEFKDEFMQKYISTYPNNQVEYRSLIDNVIAEVNTITVK